jgi:1,4-dihydroxy-2-naphthoate octaprenyltransferase
MDPAARTRVLRVAAAVVATLVAGCVLIGVSDATAVDIAGIVLVGIALVVAVAAVFYEVGASEDRERAESERKRRDP